MWWDDDPVHHKWLFPFRPLPKGQSVSSQLRCWQTDYQTEKRRNTPPPSAKVQIWFFKSLNQKHHFPLNVSLSLHLKSWRLQNLPHSQNAKTEAKLRLNKKTPHETIKSWDQYKSNITSWTCQKFNLEEAVCTITRLSFMQHRRYNTCHSGGVIIQ